MVSTAEALGAALMGAGAAWAAWALLRLRAAGARGPRWQPRHLVDDGPYRFGRHPMALGAAAVLAGAALALGSAALGLAATLFVVVLDRHWLPAEEAALRRAFGGWYADYAADVPRWW